MSVFSQRTKGYKAGIVLLFMSCLAFVLGFAAPYWTGRSLTYTNYNPTRRYPPGTVFNQGMTEVRQHYGLWVICSKFSKTTRCAAIATNTPGWMSTVHGLQCVALAGLLVSSSYAVVLNWMQRYPVHNRLVEIVAFLSGLLGFAGAVEYIVRSVQEGLDDVQQVASSQSTTSPYLYLKNSTSNVSWALVVNLGGCLFGIFSAIIIAFNNYPMSFQVTPNTNGLHSEHHINNTSNAETPTSIGLQPMHTTANTSMVYIPQIAAAAMPVSPPAYEDHFPPAVPPQPTYNMTRSSPMDNNQTLPTTEAAVGGSENATTCAGVEEKPMSTC